MAVQTCIQGRQQSHQLSAVSFLSFFLSFFQHVSCVARTSLLVDLNGGLVGVDSNDLSYKVVVTDTDLEPSTAIPGKTVYLTYKLVHGTSNHVLGDDDRTRRISRRPRRCDAVTYPEME
jgi:hypothetical protein